MVTKEYVATLYPRMIDIHMGSDERVYDLNARQIYAADLTKRVLTTFSLYAIPVGKIQNRGKSLEILFEKEKAANPNASRDDIKSVDVDMLYGSRKDATTSGLIQTSQTDNKTSFSSDGKPLADLELSDIALPEGFDVSYAHFLLYETTLHPYIEQTAAAAGRVFRSLHYVTRSGDETDEYTLTLVKAEKTTAAGPELSNFKPAPTGNDAMDAAIMKASSQPEKTQKVMEDKIGALLQRQDYLKAALAAEEMEETFGDAAVQVSSAAQQALRSNDPVTAKTLNAMSAEPKTTEDFVMQMAAFNAALQPAGEYAYILELFRAKQIRRVLQGRQLNADEQNALMTAFSKIQAAIVANPKLTGAFCDLGEAYFSMGQPATAWLMWDQAARINPQYPGLRHAANLQNQAANDFPEYF
jgi:hypothetical protein